MFHLTIILSLYILTSCQKYSQLKKHSSVKVAPLTRVYFDTKDFQTGELISLEIKMDLFFYYKPIRFLYRTSTCNILL